MRPPTLLKLVVLGLAVQVALRVRRRLKRRSRERDARAAMLVRDPSDPVQSFDEVAELQVEPLDVDALSIEDVRSAQDLATLETGIDDTAARDDLAIAVGEVDNPMRERDAGELYGVHTPPAVDHDRPDDDRAFDEGQNWLEALETSAVENGPEPERELDDIVDDEDVLRPPHASDRRDTPVADHGAGGRRGL